MHKAIISIVFIYIIGCFYVCTLSFARGFLFLKEAHKRDDSEMMAKGRKEILYGLITGLILIINILLIVMLFSILK